MQRLRAKTPSPLPIKKTASCGSLLDQIIGKKYADLSASNGFGLALPYRHNQKYKLHSSARSGGSSLPNSPHNPHARGRPVSPLALTNSHSASMERFLPGTPTDAVSEEKAAAWRCCVCDNHGPDQLERSADSFLACRRCGAVESSPQLISQVRSKNCPKNEDKTVVADAPHADARATEMNAYANGPETSDERRRRHLDSAGGSHVPKKTLKKRDMGGAQSSVDKTKAREMREHLDPNGRDATKKRAIIRMVEAVFDQIPKLDQRVQKYIRLEALRIYSASMQHDVACGRQGCLLSISARSNAVVGTCVVEHVLAQLCSSHGVASNDAALTSSLAELAPEVSQQQLASSLARVRSLQLRHASANQRMQVSSAIGIVSAWKQDECCHMCPPTNLPPPPPELRLPPSMVGSRDFGSGKCKNPTPEDRATEKLSQRVISAAKLWRGALPPQVRNRALEALTYSSIVTFLAKMGTPDEGLPIDVMSIAMLLAAARCLKYNEDAPLFAQNMFDQYSLSASTVDAHVASIASVMAETIKSAPEDPELF